uniref:ATPase WRNIP1 n=1 Tax=Timema tahoe TaxID=61484 RepID=A0A7R9IKP7_9NEOP|nr:unnamed protein product [Timema tahoe]
MSSRVNEGLSCPICGNSFPPFEIEEHANKCLFLASENNSSSSLKKFSDVQQTSPRVKRLKHEEPHPFTQSAVGSGSNSKCNKELFPGYGLLDGTGKPRHRLHIRRSVVRKKSMLQYQIALATESLSDEDNMEDSVNLIVSTVPLAEQMRPVDLTCFVGQNHVLGQDKVLRTLLQKQDIPSMILWGPPGCGKVMRYTTSSLLYIYVCVCVFTQTTLAHIIAKQCRGGAGRVRFVKLSATMSGVNEIKEAVKVAKNELGFKRRTILFMDEIHRFNKLQQAGYRFETERTYIFFRKCKKSAPMLQDIFLPHIESGTITLIGATTENPSFSLNSALLSRCRVIVLEKLDTESLVTILTRAVRGVGGRVVHQGLTSSEQDTPRFLMDSETVLWLAEMCDGDARIALNSLQLALQSQDSVPGRILMISLDDIKDGVKRSHLLYDKKGEEHYNIISAMHKSIRASDDNAALYWLTRMLQGGEDPVFIARRLVRAASEDIGTVRLSRLMLRAYLWFVSTALKFIGKIDISR